MEDTSPSIDSTARFNNEIQQRSICAKPTPLERNGNSLCRHSGFRIPEGAQEIGLIEKLSSYSIAKLDPPKEDLFLPSLLLSPFSVSRPVHHETVISTEAAPGLIVSRAVEKSASLPPPFSSPMRLCCCFHLFFCC